MAEEESGTLPRSAAHPVPAKRPTIIRVVPTAGSTPDEGQSNQSSNTCHVDPVPDPQPADSSDTVNRRHPPTRPSTGPARQAPVSKPPARPLSVHLRKAPPRSGQRPASVHLPLAQVPSVTNRPPAVASRPQKKRPEITIVGARPLSEVVGFAKGSDAAPATPLSDAADVGTAARRTATSGADQRKSSLTPVDNRSEPTGVSGTAGMSGAPPPLPTNRPKGPYVPPPLPAARPKGAYVHLGPVSSSSIAEGRESEAPKPVPKPRPRSVDATSVGETTKEEGSQAAPSRPSHLPAPNRAPEATPEQPPSQQGGRPPPPAPTKPEVSNKPPAVKPKSPTPLERTSQAPSKPLPPALPKPADKPAAAAVAPKLAERPPAPHPVPPPKPSQASNHTSADVHIHSAALPAPPAAKPAMPLLPPSSGTKYSRADILSLFDTTFQKGPKQPEAANAAATKNASTESALKFGGMAATAAASDKTKSKNEAEGLRFAGAVAQNTTAEDVNNIGGGLQELQKSEDGRKAASSFTRIARSTAGDVRSADSSSSGGDLKWQVGSSVAKNVTAEDAKNVGKAGVSLAKSEQCRKAASSIFGIARASVNQVNRDQAAPAPTPTARARPSNTSGQGVSGLGSLMGLLPPPKAQPAASKPATSAAATSATPAPSKPVPKFKISDASGGSLPRSKPTIIRPGADKPGSKPSSRNSSPEPKRKVPPPRPSTGPLGKSKGSAPARPSAPQGQAKAPSSSTNLKPKRRAPTKPGGAPEARKSSQTDSLPPRPGPGHPLYDKYMVSEPHGIALYDYKPIQKDELGFKANDIIILLSRIDADWLRGRCGNAEGLLPAAFLRIVKDVPQTDTKPSTSEPCAVAVYSFQGNTAEDLSFEKGDTIILLDRAGDQWYRGKCKGRTGIFPANHVDVIEELPDKVKASTPENVTGPRCRAKFDYQSNNAEDLTFKAGDVIKLVENVGSQWLKGQLGTRTGIFPDSFVEIIQALPAAGKKASALVNGNSGSKVTALFDFEAAENNEISFKKGDKITILSQVSSDWLHGELRNGCRGNLPAAFVDHIPANLPSFTAGDSPTEIGECIVRFDFEPVGEGEMSLKVGELVTVLEYVGEDWMRGRLGTREGIFPKAFVEMVGKDSASSAAPSLGTCKALYDFIGEEAGELTIKHGDVIDILEYVSSDWLKGRLRGKTGMFPKAFVDAR